ncbi:hypothetical protein [Ramlibacter sp.]|uniref:hypothetical protein n=1 Tax=Ramlibacter sp. TaxID=1917967 RepID=UPI0035B4CF45
MSAALPAMTEQPVLQLGVIGFDLSERAVIADALQRLPAGWTPWHVAPFAEGDAWWVNGSRTRVLEDGHLQVDPGHEREPGASLRLTAVDRPIAFSTPLAARDFEPRCVFRLGDEAGMHSALHLFGTWLQPLHCLYVAGALVMRRGAALRQTVHHLNHHGRLVAVLDYVAGHVGILPTATPGDLWSAEWDRRPPSAHDLPRNFIPYTPAQLVWTYVRRTDRDLLPPRYRHDVIHFRHVPRVPPGWLRETQMMLLRELHAEPAAFDALAQRTGLAPAALALELSCLYYSGAITTTAAKAAPRSTGASLPSQPADTLGMASIQPHHVSDLERTVPASLDLPGVVSAGPRRAG